MTKRAVGVRLCASHQSTGFFSHSRLSKAIAAALSKPSLVSLHVSVALELDAISDLELLAGGMVLSAGPRIVSRAVLVLFLNGLARSLIIFLVTVETTPWVCCKSSIPCVSGHADISSPGFNYPSTTACIVDCTIG